MELGIAVHYASGCWYFSAFTLLTLKKILNTLQCKEVNASRYFASYI